MQKPEMQNGHEKQADRSVAARWAAWSRTLDGVWFRERRNGGYDGRRARIRGVQTPHVRTSMSHLAVMELLCPRLRLRGSTAAVSWFCLFRSTTVLLWLVGGVSLAGEACHRENTKMTSSTGPMPSANNSRHKQSGVREPHLRDGSSGMFGDGRRIPAVRLCHRRRRRLAALFLGGQRVRFRDWGSGTAAPLERRLHWSAATTR